MSSYPTCRECGADLTSSEEEEQELCLECQQATNNLKGGEYARNEEHECHFSDLVFSNKVDLDGGECISVPARCRKCGKKYEEVYSKNDGLWDPDKETYVHLLA